jgi:hypothetical protein
VNPDGTGDFEAIGFDNFMSPPPEDRDQTSFFNPGYTTQACSTSIFLSETPSLNYRAPGVAGGSRESWC